MLERDSRGWYIVRISAYLIDWPRMCACCGGPESTKISAISNRIKGVEVIHITTKSWNIPYCTNCQNHIGFAHEMAYTKHLAEDTENRIKNFRYPWIINLRLLVLALGPPCGLALFMMFFVRILHVTGDKYPRILQMFFCMFASSIVTFGFALVCLWIYICEVKWYPERKRQSEIRAQAKLDELTETAKRLQQQALHIRARLQKMIRSTCTAPDQLAVQYLGRYGTVHTFHFANAVFANHFIHLNRKKTID